MVSMTTGTSARSWSAFRADSTAQPAHPLAADGQAQPGPPELARRRGVRLRERPEQLAHLLRRHADARVADPEEHPVAPPDRLAAGGQRDGAVLGELAGVAQQVE